MKTLAKVNSAGFFFYTLQLILLDMPHFEQFEAKPLNNLLSSDTAAIVKWSFKKVLERYRNGIAAGQEGQPVKPAGKPVSVFSKGYCLSDNAFRKNSAPCGGVFRARIRGIRPKNQPKLNSLDIKTNL